MELADNAPAVEAPEVTPATSEPTVPETTPVPEPAVPAKPEVSETKAFSERLNAKQKEWEQAHEQDFRYSSELARIAKGLGHQSVDAFLDAQNRAFMLQQAQERGIDPEVYEQMNKAEREAADAKEQVQTFAQQLAKYQWRDGLNEAAPAFASDPKYGAFFAANKDEILAQAYALTPNKGTEAAALAFATKMVIGERYESPKPVDIAAIKAEGVKEHLEALKKQSQPIEARGGGIPATPPATSGNVWKDAAARSMTRLRGNTV